MEPSKIGDLLNQGNEKKKTEHCEIHGDFESTLFFRNHWSKCGECMEIERKKRGDEDLVRQLQEEKERKARLLEKKIGQAALPVRFENSFLSNYITDCQNSKKALRTCLEYVESFPDNFKNGSSLILCGTVGTGKTHLAVGIAHEILQAGFQPLFCTVSKALRYVKSTYSRDSEMSERQALQTFIEPDLLILDEVGVQFGSETEKNIIFEIINGRYEEVKPTIIISNLAKDKLEEFFGERSFDRLREGGGKIIITDWKSYRSNI